MCLRVHLYRLRYDGHPKRTASVDVAAVLEVCLSRRLRVGRTPAPALVGANIATVAAVGYVDTGPVQLLFLFGNSVRSGVPTVPSICPCRGSGSLRMTLPTITERIIFLSLQQPTKGSDG